MVRFFYLKDSDTIFTTKQLLAYPFDQIPNNEEVRGFSDTITELQDYELWVGYNITDNTLDKRYLNRWSLVLMLSASHNLFLRNNLVKDISLFNVGGIFDNWDALDTENNFRKRATGVFASIWNKAKLDKNQATPISIPSKFIDTASYYNNNGTMRSINYPKIFGWRFENNNNYNGSIIITNISSDTITVSINNVLAGGVTWEKWHSDSLYTFIDSLSYIDVNSDIGTENITILPYSINVAYGNCLSDIDNDGVCDEIDNCPEDYNPNQEDLNFNEIGDICEEVSEIVEPTVNRKILTIVDVLGKKSNEKGLQLTIHLDGSVEKIYY